MSNIILLKRKATTGAPSPASLQTGEACYVLPDKKLYVKNDDATVTEINTAGGGSSRTVLTLGSAFASTVVNRVGVTGMSFAITAGKKYEIKLVGSYQSAALTTGGSIGFVLTSGTGNLIGFVTMSISQASAASDLTTTIRAVSSSNALAGSFMTSTGSKGGKRLRRLAPSTGLVQRLRDGIKTSAVLEGNAIVPPPRISPASPSSARLGLAFDHRQIP